MKKVAVFSDVHAHYANLDLVLKDAEAQGCNTYWCLGDITGRGPNPLEVVQRVHDLVTQTPNSYCILGNHDMMVLGKLDANVFIKDTENGTDISTTGMNRDIIEIALEHRAILENQAPTLYTWLSELPTHASPHPHMYIAHGYYAMKGNEQDREMAYRIYTWYSSQVDDQFQMLTKTRLVRRNPHLMAVGHTHVPGVWKVDGHDTFEHLYGWNRASGMTYNEIKASELNHFTELASQPIFLNPGSVSYPRLSTYPHPTYIVLTIHNEKEVSVLFREVVN